MTRMASLHTPPLVVLIRRARARMLALVGHAAERTDMDLAPGPIDRGGGKELVSRVSTLRCALAPTRDGLRVARNNGETAPFRRARVAVLLADPLRLFGGACGFLFARLSDDDGSCP
jgi:hypothetical protein